MKPAEQLSASYRDPSGFMFRVNGIYYRQVNKLFKEDFDYFISSGCYDELVRTGLLIPHETINENLTGSADWYQTLKPEQLQFVSYPYEWSFDMLKDAALLTLKILKKSLEKEMILKDATPFNIQLHRGKMIFIDTLSFEKYHEEEPWAAYRQFCESFLGPLLVMHYKKIPIQQLMLAWPDGIPLSILQSLLPAKSKFSFHTYLHVHLNARFSNSPKSATKKKVLFNRKRLINLVDSLEILVNKLKLSSQTSIWSSYYEEAAGRNNYLAEKKRIITEWLDKMDSVKTAADLGANNGEFSQMLAERRISTVAADFDPACINSLYNNIKNKEIQNIIPLAVDLSNPSPSIGFNNEERPSFINRSAFDLTIALALIHHLAITKNIPIQKLAELFKRITNKYLIIEFVPKEDEKVQLLLNNRKDIFFNYNANNFELSFETNFRIVAKELIGESGRILYLMEKK